MSNMDNNDEKWSKEDIYGYAGVVAEFLDWQKNRERDPGELFILDKFGADTDDHSDD